MPSTPPFRLTRVSEHVHLVQAATVNGILLTEGKDLTLIDGGYPAHGEAVEESIRSIGHRPEDVAAVLVAHAHLDHIGSLGRFVSRYDAPVYMDPVEVAHTRRDLPIGSPVDATPKESTGACGFNADVDERARTNRTLLADALGRKSLVDHPTQWWHWPYGDRYWAFMTGATHARFGPVERPVAA